MNITFACRECDRAARVEVSEGDSRFACPHCEHSYDVPAEHVVDGHFARCLICGCRELFVRSNFPQKLGVAIVVTGVVASSVAWYYHMRFVTLGILFATALIDVVLYLLVGTLSQCYRCHAEYRGLEDPEQHGAFDLETHERFRQQAARLEQ